MQKIGDNLELTEQKQIFHKKANNNNCDKGDRATGDTLRFLFNMRASGQIIHQTILLTLNNAFGANRFLTLYAEFATFPLESGLEWSQFRMVRAGVGHTFLYFG